MTEEAESPIQKKAKEPEEEDEKVTLQWDDTKKEKADTFVTGTVKPDKEG